MALKPAICTQCGGQIQVDDSKEAGICPNCGTAFITERVINQFVTQNNFAGATINVQGGPNVENLITLARRAINARNKEDVFKYYAQIREIDPNNAEAEFYYSVITGDKFSDVVKRTIDMLVKNGEDNDEKKFHIYGFIESVLGGVEEDIFLLPDDYGEYWKKQGEYPWKISGDLFDWFTTDETNLDHMEVVKCLVWCMRVTYDYNDSYINVLHYSRLKVLKNDERYAEFIANEFKRFMSFLYDTVDVSPVEEHRALADEATCKKFKLKDDRWRVFSGIKISNNEFNELVALVKKYNSDFTFYTYEEVQKYLKYYEALIEKKYKRMDIAEGFENAFSVLKKIFLVIFVLAFCGICYYCFNSCGSTIRSIFG